MLSYVITGIVDLEKKVMYVGNTTWTYEKKSIVKKITDKDRINDLKAEFSWDQWDYSPKYITSSHSDDKWNLIVMSISDKDFDERRLVFSSVWNLFDQGNTTWIVVMVEKRVWDDIGSLLIQYLKNEKIDDNMDIVQYLSNESESLIKFDMM